MAKKNDSIIEKQETTHGSKRARNNPKTINHNAMQKVDEGSTASSLKKKKHTKKITSSLVTFLQKTNDDDKST